MSNKFNIGDIVKFIGKKSGEHVPEYDINGEHIIHGMTILGKSYCEEYAEVVCFYEQYVGVKYTDKNGKIVCLNFLECYLEIVSSKNILKNENMDINEISKLDKDVIKLAKKNVLMDRKESQTRQAEAFLANLFDVKDAIEDKIGNDQANLDEVNKGIAVFDVK